MTLDVIVQLLFSVLMNALGEDWKVDDVAEKLREMKGDPPRKASIPDLKEALDG